MKVCCVNCFNDNFLRARISELSETIGKCNYCEANSVEIINVNLLQDKFEELFELYEEGIDGKLLSELIHHDWKMFNIEKYASNSLLADILEIEEVLTKKYVNRIDKTSSDEWDKFKEELKHKNRYFPNDTKFNKEDLKEISQNLEAYNYPEDVYRARICKDGNIIPKEKMGKPPSGLQTQGRANPIGISYLYVASDKETAVSEIRPDKGDRITISKIKLPNTLRFFDTRSPKNTISPFEYSDNVLEALYKDMDLLERFGEELSQPILPREAGIEYISSQYLSELIKHWGFDGILYKSSVGSGFNIVIFSDVELEFIETKLYSVDNLVIDFSSL